MKRIVSSIAAVLLSAASAQARDLTPQVRAMIFGPPQAVRLSRPVVTIPMQGTDYRGYYKCPYFQVYVNGKGPFTFLFDTGSSYTLVSSKVARAAETPVVFDRGGERDVVRIAKMQIGGAALIDVWAIRDDDFGVDGILGFPVFGSSNVLFDLPRRRLQVSAVPIPLAGSFELAYQAPHNVPTIPVTVANRPVQTLIDTGDDAYAWEMRSVELGDAAFVHAPIAAETVLNGATLQPTSVTTLAVPIGLGPLHAASPIVGINDSLPVGDFGVDMLRQFRFEFVPAKRVVTFQPLFAGDSFVIAGDSSPGFKIVFDGSGKVGGVIPGSTAARAGMSKGDTILSIDGQPAGAFTPRTWDARIAEGTPLSARWTGKDGEHTAMLPVEELR